MTRRLALRGLAVAGAIALGGAAATYWFLSRDGVRVALEYQASAWLGHPVRIARATGQVLPRLGIRLRDVRIGEPARITLAEVEISTSLRALVSGRIEDATVVVADSRVELPLPIAGGTAPADAAAPATVGPPLQVVSVGTIALRNITVISRGREIVASADASLAGRELRLDRFAASSGRTTLEASGTVALDPSIDAQLDVSANRLDMDELLALAAAFLPDASPGVQGAARPPARLAARVTADAATFASIDARRLTADLLLDGDRVTLEPLGFELFGGTYDGAVRATLGDTLDVRVTSALAGLDVAQLAAFGGVPDTITGRLSGRGTFAGRGADVGAMLHAARGSGTASIEDGTIRRLNLIRTVVLFFGRPAPDAPPGADAFDRLDATFSLEDEVITAEEFVLRSPDADIVGRGTLSLASKALDGTADLRLSESLSKQAGTDLVRFTREGNRVVLPADISGTLAAPRITIDAAAAARRGLRNEAERRLRDLFDGLGR